MLFDPDDRPRFEEIARRVRLGAAVDEVVDQYHGRPQGSEHEDGDEHDGEHAQLSRATIDPPRVACDDGHEQDAFDQREQPCRTRTHRVGQEDRQHHRCDDRSGHRPASFADDHSVRARPRAARCRRRGHRAGIVRRRTSSSGAVWEQLPARRRVEPSFRPLVRARSFRQETRRVRRSRTRRARAS